MTLGAIAVLAYLRLAGVANLAWPADHYFSFAWGQGNPPDRKIVSHKTTAGDAEPFHWKAKGAAGVKPSFVYE